MGNLNAANKKYPIKFPLKKNHFKIPERPEICRTVHRIYKIDNIAILSPLELSRNSHNFII